MALVGVTLLVALSSLCGCGSPSKSASPTPSPKPSATWDSLPRFGKVVTLLDKSKKAREFVIGRDDVRSSGYTLAWTDGKHIYLRRMNSRFKTVDSQVVGEAGPGEHILDLAMDYPTLFWSIDSFTSAGIRGLEIPRGKRGSGQPQWQVGPHMPKALFSNLSVCWPYLAWQESSENETGIYLLELVKNKTRPVALVPYETELQVSVSTDYVAWREGDAIVGKHIYSWESSDLMDAAYSVDDYMGSGPELNYLGAAVWIVQGKDRMSVAAQSLSHDEGEILERAPEDATFSDPAAGDELAAWVARDAVADNRASILAHRLAPGWNVKEEWLVWSGKLDAFAVFGNSLLDTAGEVVAWRTKDGRVMAARGEVR